MTQSIPIPQLNPRIKEIQVGTRELRDIQIYPFSAGQEIEVVELVGVLLNAISEAQADGNLEDLQVIELFATTIKDKMDKIIKFVTDPKDEVSIADFDNHQLADFVEIIFEVNFGEAVKKFQTVWGKAKILFPSQKSSEKSSGKPVTA